MPCKKYIANISKYDTEVLYNWCTNCGNYGIFTAVKRALVDSDIAPHEAILTFDIGCGGNGADKIGGYRIHGLHGRSIPLGAGISIANSDATVISFGGDGGTLNEGLNHLIHAIRSNYNMVFILHNNANYGLTTGQASPTTKQGVSMNSSPDGVSWDTMNVMELVLSLNPSFAARSFSGHINHMTETIKEGIAHNGFAFIEILQTCTTYNKETPHEWYLDRVYDVSEKNHDSNDLDAAKHLAGDLEENVAIGVLYRNDKKSFMERLVNRKEKNSLLIDEVKEVSVKKMWDKLD